MEQTHDPTGAASLRRWTLVGLGLLLAFRLTLLSSNLLRSRGNGFRDVVESGEVPRYFDTHASFMRLSSVLVVAAVFALAWQLRGKASRVIVLTVVFAGVGYATGSFFGPNRWIFTIPGPYVDFTGDTAGYAWLLIAEVLLGALLLTAVLTYERAEQVAGTSQAR